MGSWHDQILRVRYAETDRMKVVYYSEYFVWMEVGRVNLLRDVGLAYGEWEKKGLEIPVVQAHADYRSSAHFDEEIFIKTRVARIGNSSIRFENEIYVLPEKKLLCTGHTVHALTNRQGRTIPFPDDIRNLLISS